MAIQNEIEGTRLKVLEKSDIIILGIIYERNGRICQAWPISEARRKQLGLLNASCTCGSADFCDTINGYRVRCFDVGGGRCEWFETSDVC